ncbi:dTDP-glucose 4,6-dehydratase [bacterium]|jgi:dTDP-glucose 4,6-dehydratase|nr:dTDP-glucose 4,6-dehydratase [bacterium]
MTNYLVTGGCGFIGSNFIKFIMGFSDTTVCNIDKLTYAGNPLNLLEFENDERYSFYRVDICDKKKVETIFKSRKIDIVVHFAAESHVDRSILSGIEFVKTNVEGTQSLIDVSRDYSVQQFIHVSTDEVYGSIKEPGKFTEKSELHPNSPYAASKASSDLMVLAAIRTHDFPAKITRCSNNYGPFQYPEKLIPLMVSNILEGKSLPIYGTGANIRDWIYVDDHCEGIYSVITKGRAGEVYNIGGRSEIKNIDLVHKIADELGVVPTIDFVKDRLAHDERYAIDFSKISKECDWHPNIGLERGLKNTISWYENNTGWLDKVKSNEYITYYKAQYEKS